VGRAARGVSPDLLPGMKAFAEARRTSSGLERALPGHAGPDDDGIFDAVLPAGQMLYVMGSDPARAPHRRRRGARSTRPSSWSCRSCS
jgi:hypothetical protein